MRMPNFIHGIVRKIATAFRRVVRPLVSGTAAAVLGFALATEAAPKFTAAVLAGTIMGAVAYSEAEGSQWKRIILRRWLKPDPPGPGRYPEQNPWSDRNAPTDDFLRGEWREHYRTSRPRSDWDFLSDHDTPTRNFWRDGLRDGRRGFRQALHRHSQYIADCLDKDPEEDYISIQCARIREIADCLSMDPEDDYIGPRCARMRKKFALETGECSTIEEAQTPDCRNKWIWKKIREECATGKLLCDELPYGGDIRGARRIDDILRNQTPYRQTWEPLPNQLPPPSPEFPAEVKP